jgi:uncharacterized protein (DUF362 family)/membrane protease YdiL (CAAX protease family)
MENIVVVKRGDEKFSCFQELLEKSGFDQVLLQAYKDSRKKEKDYFRIAIKPNMMVFINPKAYKATVTDKELVEYLVDHIRRLGFNDISICEAQNDVGRMLKNHNVKFIARKIGYDPQGRYKIVDLTEESETFHYRYKDEDGRIKKWKDKVGKTWKEADFRITFAKCKTHEHDWMTLGVKNVYGCFPRADKVCRYHIRNEIFDVTARMMCNFPVHFSFVDAWVGSDGFQGYKIAHPQELKMLFGGADAVAVDMEIFKRAGLDPKKSKILGKSVEQLYDGVYPQYEVKGDEHTQFDQLVLWENICDDVVQSIDVLEEVYFAWAFINLEPAAKVIDYKMFPPRSIFHRFAVWGMKQLYSLFKLSRTFNTQEQIRKMEQGILTQVNILTIIWNTVKKLSDKASVILWSSFILLLIWGFHGDMAVLTALFGEGWIRSLTSNLPWGKQLISFIVGFVLVVLIPCLIIKFGFKSKIRDFGLGLPPPEQRRKARVAFLALLVITSVFIFAGSFLPSMQQEYPLFTQRVGGQIVWTMTSWGEFIIYELIYLLFFITIEFAFRGYLLFGLYSIKVKVGEKDKRKESIQRFGIYSILIQMLAYTTWHYGKPVPEMVGTVIWGVCVAAIALRIKSIWPIIIPHWLYNVFLDLLIWKQLNKKILNLFS